LKFEHKLQSAGITHAATLAWRVCVPPPSPNTPRVDRVSTGGQPFT